MQRCFVIQPFDGGPFDRRYRETIEPAIVAAGLEPYRVDQDASAEVPIESIEREIASAAICVADLSTDNPNVWYELGFARAAQVPVCMIVDRDLRSGKLPFDIQHRRVIFYQTGSSSDFDKLGESVTATLTAYLGQRDAIRSVASVHTAEGGLAPHELTALALITASAHLGPGGASAYALTREMESAGFTSVATSVALSELENRGLVERRTLVDQHDREEYYAYETTISGDAWIAENTDKLQLRRTPPDSKGFSVDDIPW